VIKAADIVLKPGVTDLWYGFGVAFEIVDDLAWKRNRLEVIDPANGRRR